MEKKTIIKYSLIIIGILVCLFAFLGIKTIFEDFLINSLSFDMGLFFKYFIIFLIGYYILSAGFTLENFFKHFTRSLVGLAVLFITFVFFMLPMYSHADDLANSIQPSIDYMLVSSLDDLLDMGFDIENNTKINLLLGENTSTNKFSNSNLTILESKKLLDLLGFSGSHSDTEIQRASKLLITLIYTETTNAGQSDVAISASQFKEQLEAAGFNEESLFADLDLLEENFKIDDNAFVVLLFQENEQKRTVDVNALTKKDISLIWSNLNINSKVSIETQQKVIEILLKGTIQQLLSQDLLNDDFNLPIASLSSAIPKEVESFFYYDLFNNNISIRIDELSKLRDECNEKNETDDLLCENILKTEYNEIMNGMNDPESLEQLESMGVADFDTSFLDDFNTIDKLKNKLRNMSSYWILLLFLGVIFYILAFGSYYLHFKLFNRELIPIHLPYYVAKVNFWYYLPSYVFIVIITYFFLSGGLLNFISNIIMTGEEMNIIALLSESPFYLEMLNIVKQSLSLATYFFIFSLISYGILYFFMIKKIKWVENHSNNNNSVEKDITEDMKT